jgi:catecholate siderophore receptor
MAHIKSRKHPIARRLNCSTAVALAVLAMPASVYAQQTTDSPAQSTETLPQITVRSASPDSYKADTVSSPKFTQPLVDTPQTITVIKKELAQEQGATTLTEALKNTPGVGTFFLGENGNTNTGDAIYMRGFDSSSSIFVDGVRDLGSISRDLFNIEQVEVGKGPNGADYGRTSPTGSINLVTKQPTLKNAASTSISGGTDDYKRVTADVNRVIGDESAIRVNLLRDDSDVAGRDVAKNSRTGVAAGLAFGLKSDTRTYFDVLHVEQKNIPDGGVPTIGLPGYSSPDPARSFLTNAARVNSSNFYGSASDYDNVTADMVTAIVEHDITPDTTLRNVTRYGRTSEDYRLTSFLGSAANIATPNPNDPSTWTIVRGTGTAPNTTSTFKDQVNEIISNQTNLTTKFATGSVRHELSTGLELTHETQSTTGLANTGTLVPANLYNPNPNDPVGAGVPNGAYTQGQTNTAGAYVFDTLKVGERWQYLAGLRLDRYTTGYRSIPATGTTTAPTDLALSGTLVNWKFAALYKPAANGSVYVSYATSMQPPGGSNFALSTSANNAGNPSYDPQKAKTIEVGTKWDLMERRLGLTAALYRTDVSNDVIQDPTDPAVYIQEGKKRVEGLELGVIGEISPVWNVSAGYTIMNTSVTNGPAVTQAGNEDLSYTPKQAFTSWTTYKLPFGWTVGGGARFVGSLQRGTDSAIGTPTYVQSYWVYDAMASYKISKNMDLQLNAFNLTDKEYVASINKSGYRYIPGTPRTFRLTANIKF